MTELEKIVAALDGKSSGGGYFMCRCPAHEDNHASLAVKQGDSAVLVSCKAGCGQAEIISALQNLGLWSGRNGSGTFQLTKTKVRKLGKKTAEAADEGVKPKIISKNHVEDYIYTDENGYPLFKKQRFALEYDTGEVGKTFVQQRWEGEQWVFGLKDTRRVLYNLPAIVTAKSVILCEGEKAANAVCSLGLVASCPTEGAGGAWRDEYTESLKGKSVVLLPDNDAPGRLWGEKVGAALVKSGIRVRMVNLPGLPEKGDAFDWVELGGNKEKLRVLVSMAVDLVAEGEGEESSEIEGFYTSHLAFVSGLYGEMIRDYFDDGLYGKKHGGGDWVRINEPSVIKAIRGESCKHVYVDENGKPKPMYQKTLFEDVVEAHRESLKPKLRLAIPEWDGRDRIAEICKLIKCPEFNEIEVYEIIREWCAMSWARIFNPHIEQHFLLLTGPQGAGKDSVVDALVGGYGAYRKNLVIDRDQMKNERALSTMIVANVAEFDKCNHAEVSHLKDLVDKKTLDFDQKYMKGLQSVRAKHSFIGSANTVEVLRDSTGNRRFYILEVGSLDVPKDNRGYIKHICSYPGDPSDSKKKENQLQLIAQHKANAVSGNYRVSENTALHMKRVVERLTPPDEKEEHFETFLNELYTQFTIWNGTSPTDKWENDKNEDALEWAKTKGWVCNRDLQPVYKRCQDATGVRNITFWRKLVGSRLGRIETNLCYDKTRQRGVVIADQIVEWGSQNSNGSNVTSNGNSSDDFYRDTYS